MLENNLLHIFYDRTKRETAISQLLDRGEFDKLANCLIQSANLSQSVSEVELLLRAFVELHQQQLNSTLVFTETDDLNAGDCYSNSCSLLKKVFNYIKANYREGIRLDDVAKEVDYTPGYLTQKVKRKIGISIKQLIIKYRLEDACAQLLETNNSIESIAESVGYNNPTYFYTQFRQHYGTTPKEWRETNR